MKIASAIFTFALTAQGMTPSWYFIGINRPLNVLWSESLPRIMVTTFSAILVAAGGPVVVYSILMLATVPFAQLAAARLIDDYSAPTRADWRAAPRIAKAQAVIGSGRAVSVVYTTLPVFIVGLVAPPALGLFAASERLMRTGVTVLSAIPLRLQSWIGSAPPGAKEHRIRKAQQIGALTAVVAGLGFTVFAPPVSHYLFSGKIDIPYTLSPMGGILLFTIVLSTSQGLALIARDRANDITWAIVPSAIVGVATIAPGAVAFGPKGAIAGEILAETCGLLIQFRSLRRPRARHYSRSFDGSRHTI
ncbi:hypothetical protein [Flexivirga meconopsidis]|uniref:hypothetical protein n=1 Tax=Flexivirga meconopsidis TaxID=2977121 RepID=UPI00224073B5|nr:hypothetical protein [Flexivirga meconopsidis]